MATAPAKIRALDASTEYVRLGAHTYEIHPQPLPYLRHHLGSLFEQLETDGVEDAEDLLSFVSGKFYETLKVFIPDLMPRHEWEGYESEVAFEGGLYSDEWARKAPDGQQVRRALTVCFEVSGLDVWKTFGKLLDPTLLRATVTRYVAGFLSSNLQSASSPQAPTPSTTSSFPVLPTEDDAGSTSDPAPSSTESGPKSEPTIDSASSD